MNQRTNQPEHRRRFPRLAARPRLLLAAAAALAALSLLPAIPAAGSSLRATDTLSGSWQVTRTCVSGCTGTTILKETVSPFQGRVFSATGGLTMKLYRLGKTRVLAHASASSSLLTIRTPGSLMRGSGVGQDGSTFKVTWKCVAPPSMAETVQNPPHPGTQALHYGPDLRGIC